MLLFITSCGDIHNKNIENSLQSASDCEDRKWHLDFSNLRTLDLFGQLVGFLSLFLLRV